MQEERLDAPVVRAIERVLAAEREARQAVARCERECAELLEGAREERRHILDRAQRRVVCLHARNASMVQGETPAPAVTADSAGSLPALANPARQAQALERLGAWLTSPTPQGRDDEF